MLNNLKKRIASLRKLMRENNMDAYIVPHNDEYLSEYVPPNKERLNWICGFSGSAGSLLVTLDKLFLFTDGRYLLQAKHETKGLKCEIINISNESLYNFLKKNHLKYGQAGIDAKTISKSDYLSLKQAIDNTSLKIKAIDHSLIDDLWKRETKVQNTEEIFFLSQKYVGLSNNKKLDKIYSYLLQEKADYLFIQDSESVAWLNNLRGRDLPHTPITFCCSLISKNDQKVFFENSSIPANIKKKFPKKTKIFSLNKLEETLKKECKKKSKIIVDQRRLSLFNYNVFNKVSDNIISKSDIILSLRSIKNKTEIKCTEKAHILDGVALCKFLYWYKNYNGALTELEIVKKINSIRKKNKYFICTSFPTIAGAGKNGAIIHYQPNETLNKKINKADILLLDSGGQYFYGTTDVTRTISRSKKNDRKVKFDYTTVLKSHINVNLSIFPPGAPGSFLDVVARKKLWEVGEDFAHSTGHGVGFCLNVHEGPFSISLKNKLPIYDNMVFSNEPGLYRNGKYGIRIENLVYTKKINYNKKKFIILETLTLAPYERELIDASRLNHKEKKWLNNYHKSVIKNIGPFLNKKEKIWLKNQCKEI